MIETYSIDPRIAIREDTVDELFRVAPQIIRVTDFDEKSVSEFADAISLIHRADQGIVPILIDSYGGDVYALWSMVDILLSTSLPIATIIEGKAMSCAAALFTCGTEGMRYIGPNATIMIHDVTATRGNDESKSEDVKADAAETERLNRAFYGLMEKNAKKRKNAFWNMVQGKGRADWYITPQEAVKLNIANHIGIPIFRTTVSVETVLELP